jgi:hypothetical protein
MRTTFFGITKAPGGWSKTFDFLLLLPLQIRNTKGTCIPVEEESLGQDSIISTLFIEANIFRGLWTIHSSCKVDRSQQAAMVN